MSDCIFCKIIAGEIPAVKIYEDEKFLVFLDMHAINPGHSLVIPKEHVNYVFDMQEPLYTEIFQLAKKIAPSLREATAAKRIGLAVEGFGVPHIHVHLVPVNSMNELNPERAQEVSLEDREKLAEKIRNNL